MQHVCLNQTNLFISHLCQIQSTTFNARKTNNQSSTEILLDNGAGGIRTHGRHLGCAVAFSMTLVVTLINNIPGKIAKLAPDQVWSQPFFSRARQKNSWHSNFKIYASWKKRKKAPNYRPRFSACCCCLIRYGMVSAVNGNGSILQAKLHLYFCLETE